MPIPHKTICTKRTESLWARGFVKWFSGALLNPMHTV